MARAEELAMLDLYLSDEHRERKRARRRWFNACRTFVQRELKGYEFDMATVQGLVGLYMTIASPIPTVMHSSNMSYKNLLEI